MLKPVIDFFKPIVSAYRRLMQAEDNIKKLGERANKHEDGQRVTEATLIEVLHQLDKDRAVAIEQRRTAERDYDNLVLRLQLAVKDSEQRALPSGAVTPPAAKPDLLTRLEALEQRVKTLENKD